MKRPRRYHWNEWFRHRHLKLVRGVHYFCNQQMMCQQVRNAASSRELSVTVENHGDHIIVWQRAPTSELTPEPTERAQLSPEVPSPYSSMQPPAKTINGRGSRSG